PAADPWLGAEAAQAEQSEAAERPPADPAAVTAAIQDPLPAGWVEPAPASAPDLAQQDDREVERGLRGLVGGGSSQVGVTAALRARDATRPTEQDIAAAETELVIIRRGWTPPPG
ncbi:MAG: hypothetical protein J2P15_09610, partial [Micromonosporaceae bacterium]|nr:hypothetical protein [Micromonosporaceae bacterium]